jgi:predicted acetyltransferase
VAFQIREVNEDNFDDLFRVAFTAFGEEMAPEHKDSEKLITEYERMMCVMDGDQIVATGGAYSFDLTVPGGATPPMAGVTWIACLPTHRRRGILRKMMKHQLDDVVRRGEPIAGLTASEAVIYGRFGYGVATQFVDAKIRKSDTAFAVEPKASGRIRLVWDDERKKVLPPVFDTWRRQRVGSINRSDGRWEQILLDLPVDRHGATSMYCAVHEDRSGTADGYAQYRFKGMDDENGSVIVREVVAVDPEVEAALWRYVLDLDLATRVEVRVAPPDTPLHWRLANQRAFRIDGQWDFLWLRVLDVPAALSARTYATEGSLVLDITDPFRPRGAAAGTFLVEGGPDGGSCRKVKGGKPDLTLSVEALGSAYLGGVKWSTLAAAGRVSGKPDALRRADALFASTPLPFCNTGF